MARRGTRALYIVGWHEHFEPTYTARGQTRYYHASPGRFIERVHTGEKRARIFRRYGVDGALWMIGVYDQLRQYSAAQAVELRGWLTDSFGRALNSDEMVSLLLQMWRIPDETAPRGQILRSITRLIAARWFRWAFFGGQTGRPNVPTEFVSDRTTRRYSAEGVRNVSGTVPDTFQTEFGTLADSRQQTADSREQIANSRQQDQTRSRTRCSSRQGGPGESATGETAALPVCPEGTDPRALLKAVGFDAVAVEDIVREAGEDAQFIREAVEAAEIMHSAGKLQRGPKAYIRAYVGAGGYTLPGNLESRRKEKRR